MARHKEQRGFRFQSGEPGSFPESHRALTCCPYFPSFHLARTPPLCSIFVQSLDSVPGSVPRHRPHVDQNSHNPHTEDDHFATIIFSFETYSQSHLSSLGKQRACPCLVTALFCWALLFGYICMWDLHRIIAPYCTWLPYGADLEGEFLCLTFQTLQPCSVNSGPAGTVYVHVLVLIISPEDMDNWFTMLLLRGVIEINTLQKVDKAPFVAALLPLCVPRCLCLFKLRSKGKRSDNRL